MIRKFLRKLAIKYLGLINPPNCLLQDEVFSLHVANDNLKLTIQAQNEKMERIKEKYPTVWLGGDAAQGVVQLPNLKMAVEFYREENRFCVFVPWDDAAGVKPTEFVPPWLEVDESLSIASSMEKQSSGGIVFKIPVKGWNDTIELSQRLEDSHPSFDLQGNMIEKTRTFRSRAGKNGTYRRTWKDGKVSCHVWYMHDEFPKPGDFRETTAAEFLPPGNLAVDPSRFNEWEFYCLGDHPNRIYHWIVPVIEKDVPKVGYQKTKQLGSAALHLPKIQDLVSEPETKDGGRAHHETEKSP